MMNDHKAQKLTDNVYAIIGPLGQRSMANAGLNANYGFVVTDKGVILIDSGASAHSAAMLGKAISQVTAKPVRWVFNTGSQDHRWLGNEYFARKEAQIQALAETVQTQKMHGEQQIAGLTRFVGDQMKGTQAQHVVHGHGRGTDMTQTQKETGDCYNFLITNIGVSARNMDLMSETLDKFLSPSQFKSLQNFNELHRANMNRIFVDFESNCLNSPSERGLCNPHL